jgi:hypothetical protein
VFPHKSSDPSSDDLSAYQRIMESDTIAEDIKLNLQKQYQSLNPAQLQRQLQKKLLNVFQLMRSVTKTNLALTE